MMRPSRGEFALRPYLIGGGRIEQDGAVRRLIVDGAGPRRYADAQLDDYSGLPRGRFQWRPPLRLQLRARLSPGVRGTAGFGFWNNPFSPVGGIPVLPDAVWFFFGSPPNDLALVPGVPGRGWKASSIHAARLGAIAWGVPVGPLVLWARITGLDGLAARGVQRLTGAHEAPLPVDPAEWHRYELDWGPRDARFAVDGVEALVAPAPPPGPLGFVAWIDNQYAVATPRGGLGWGLLEVTTPQWLEIELEELGHGD